MTNERDTQMITTKANYWNFVIFSFLLILVSTSCTENGNNDIKGNNDEIIWGGFTWGITEKEVFKNNPEFKIVTRERNTKDEFHFLEKKINLFGERFDLRLYFDENEGLDAIHLNHYFSPSLFYDTDRELILSIFNTLKSKYGEGFPIKYDDKEGTNNYAHAGEYYDEGGLGIHHKWNFNDTIVEYNGDANGKSAANRNDYNTAIPHLAIYIKYRRTSLTDYSKL